jgi:hypothetical protein
MVMESTIAKGLLMAGCLIFAATAWIPGALSQPQPSPARTATMARGPLSYADIADLADSAPMVASARITRTLKLPQEQAIGVQPGFQRLFVEAQVTGLIRGEGGISPNITYLYDAPLDAKGKAPKLKKADVILFARPGSRPGEIQLVARDAQIASTPATLETVKSVLAALVANGAAPRITGLGDAFHVAGTVAGEGETQIFLRTEGGDPVSLSILRRPGQPPQWAVALGEIVDEAAKAPQPGSLLWYRLACSLPPALPARSVRTLSVQDAEAARADYLVVVQALGPCQRTRAG